MSETLTQRVHHRGVTLAVCLIIVILLSGCSTIGRVEVGADPIHSKTISTASLGDDFALYSLDIGPEPRTAVFFVTGSGCASLSYYLKSYFKGLVGSWRVYAVQKTGVGAHDMGLLCSQEFYDHYNFENLKLRNELALAAVLRRHGEVAGVIGVSEGGQIAAELMHSNKMVCALVVIGSGGLPFRSAGAILDARHGKNTFAEAFARVSTAPHSTSQKVLGFPNKYWATFIDRDPASAYLSLDRPVLMIFGGRDEAVPIESARWLDNRFRTMGKTNFSLLEFPEADHILKQQGVDRRPEAMNIVASFFQKNQKCTLPLQD